MNIRCPHCGFENDVPGKFCIHCGRELATGPTTTQPKKLQPLYIVAIGGAILIAAFAVWFFIIRPQKPLAAEIDQNLSTTQSMTPSSVQNEPSMENGNPSIVPTQQTVIQTVSNEPRGKIVFTCQVDRKANHDQICIINADGSGFRQLTNDLNQEHFYPSLSPDGQSILFSRSVKGKRFEIFEMDLSGSIHQITHMEEQLYAPEYSPDDSQIVFTRHIDAANQFIAVMNRDGSNVRNLTRAGDPRDPIWSPDGSQILYTAGTTSAYQIYVMNTDGSEVKRITQMSGLRGRSDWSTDDLIATYAGNVDKHDREIYLINADQSPQKITNGGDNLAPSFSPDGEWIAFMSYRDHFWDADGCEIYIMRKDGTDVRRLSTNDYCDYQPRWGH